MTTKRTIRIGTSDNPLSRATAAMIGEQIGRVTDAGIEVVLIAADAHAVHTLRTALLENDCDVIVHALRELPVHAHPGLVVGAVPERSDARDVLCARDSLTLADLPAGSRVGADSARRMAQLNAVRHDIEVVEVHASVLSRLALVGTGPVTDTAPATGTARLDAVVLDAASLARLDQLDRVTEFFELSDWPTTPGQGAVALEVRGDDARNVSVIRAMLTRLDHRPTRAATTAERCVLTHLAGLVTALGATALTDSGLLLLSATAYREDGGEKITSSHGVVLDGMSPAESRVAVDALGRTVANELVRHGAAELASLGSHS